MTKNLLNTNVQDFIKKYSGDISKLAFSGSPFDNIDTRELIEQIEGSLKAKGKLPSWFNSEGILYPPKLNIEQTSSEITANYKASLIKGTTIADITGGLGVDSYFFAQSFKMVHHFEIDEVLSEIAQHNFKQLGRNNIECFAKDGMRQVMNSMYDVIYADPSRRHDIKGKVFFLKDCLPNIPENLSELMKHCNTLIIKTSPMLDITKGLSELAGVFEIHIVAVNNEVKELLWLLRDGFSTSPLIRTINISKTVSEKFDFKMNDTANTVYAMPEQFLYEPNSALLKSGAYELLSAAFKVKKLHKHSHLYTSESLKEFPGRRFTIENIVPYTKAAMRAGITFDKANISTRNFPESVETIRKKWKIKDGGSQYLFFTTLENNQKTVLICSKI